MSNRYHVHFRHSIRHSIRHSMRYFFHPHEIIMRGRVIEWELEREYSSKNDPEKPPPPKRGDIYILLGTIIGMIAGGVSGAIIGIKVQLNIFCIALCFFGGVIIGALLGVFLGGIIKKHTLHKGT